MKASNRVQEAKKKTSSSWMRRSGSEKMKDFHLLLHLFSRVFSSKFKLIVFSCSTCFIERTVCVCVGTLGSQVSQNAFCINQQQWRRI